MEIPPPMISQEGAHENSEGSNNEKLEALTSLVLETGHIHAPEVIDRETVRAWIDESQAMREADPSNLMLQLGYMIALASVYYKNSDLEEYSSLMGDAYDMAQTIAPALATKMEQLTQ